MQIKSCLGLVALAAVATVPPHASARTMALDPAMRRVYLAAETIEPERSGTPKLLHRTLIPNSFNILVAEPQEARDFHGHPQP